MARHREYPHELTFPPILTLAMSRAHFFGQTFTLSPFSHFTPPPVSILPLTLLPFLYHHNHPIRSSPPSYLMFDVVLPLPPPPSTPATSPRFTVGKRRSPSVSNAFTSTCPREPRDLGIRVKFMLDTSWGRRWSFTRFGWNTSDAKCSEFKIQNIVGSCDVKFLIRFEGFGRLTATDSSAAMKLRHVGGSHNGRWALPKAAELMFVYRDRDPRNSLSVSSVLGAVVYSPTLSRERS
ncbi:hypothetical protein NLJ89_g10172 [Agrocybe chaxingu]|uniref:Uncharacterized protein n=1 Tax=Agrocybe chaxingu TaxID=84603 RepID=A0A9W8JUN0_9AGAR|nr:hypothetical protein NLJ89_g10172 [Agrocybe chaxingu]